MKRILKLAVLFVVIASMFFSVVSCKKKEPDTSTKDGNSGSKPSHDLTGTTITAYYWGNELSEDEKNLVKYIEGKTGAKVVYISIPYGNMDMKYVLDVSSGNPPDLLYLTDERFPRYIVKGLGQPLEDYADYFAEGDEFWEKVKANSPFKWKGKTYGGSTGSSPYLVWYNKTMFEENDVKTPLEYYNEGKWNFDALAEIGKALTADTNNDGELDRFGFLTWKRDNFIIANGGKFFEFTPEGNIRVALKDKPVLNALEYIQKAAYTDKWQLLEGDFVKDFISGRTAMTVETTWVRNVPFADVKFEVDFVPLPVGPDNTTGVSQGFGGSLGITLNAKNPYGALAYMKYSYEYDKEQENKPGPYDHLYTPEQKQRLKDIKEKQHDVSFFYGIGNMASKMQELFADICNNNTPVATAVDKVMDAWEHEVEVTIKDNQLPQILPFTAPPAVDFESDDYKNTIVVENTDGNLEGLDSATITEEAGVAIKGKSLKLDVTEGSPFQLFRFNDSIKFPDYHTYTVSFDYRILGNMDPEGRYIVAITPRSSTIGGPYNASAWLNNVKAGDTGTFKADLDLYEFAEDYTLAIVGVGAGDIVIDNIKVEDKK